MLALFARAGDVIRVADVPAVLACALPLSSACESRQGNSHENGVARNVHLSRHGRQQRKRYGRQKRVEIGRASCREREKTTEGTGTATTTMKKRRKRTRQGTWPTTTRAPQL